FLEPELANVEVERLILIENPHMGDVDLLQHAPKSTQRGELRASPKLLGRVHAIAKHVGTALMLVRLRYSTGDSPMISRNVRLKVPRLLKPTSRQISVMLASVSRSR